MRVYSGQRPLCCFQRTLKTEAREVVQSLRAVALTEDWGLILRTHMTAHNLISAPDLTSLLISLGTGHACGGHTCIRAKHSHIHLNFFKLSTDHVT